MKVKDLIEKLGLKVLTDNTPDKEISGCYIGDLLSLVMSKGKLNEAWITVQTNINIVAVATLVEFSCIIIPENIEVDESTIKKANMQDVIILSSDKTGYELACEINKII